jgi:arabinogalactan endo-1,4-beta-galactosidase
MQGGEAAGLSRRVLLARAMAGGAAWALPSVPAWARPARAAAPACPVPGFRTSLSVSPFTESVLQATSLSDGVRTVKHAKDLQRLFNAHGATEVYARIATREHSTDPNGADWARGLQRAALARELGMPFNPELGLFAYYGDGATYQQPPDFTDYPSIRLPGPWLSLKIAQMTPAMRQYGELVARQILGTGVRVNYWDLGNEVENGVAGVAVRPLFPDTTYQPPDAVDPAIGQMSVPELIAMPEAERIAWCRAHLWPYVGALLAATADGIRSVDRNARFSTHISDFGQRSPGVQLAFWEAMREAGYLPDQLGTSYYPTDGKTALGPADKFAWLKDTASGLAAKFARKLFIAEYAYPTAVMPPPYPFNDTVDGYPQTPSGQHDFTRDLVTWGITSGHLAGIRPWAPDFCTNSGWQPMSFFTAPEGGRASAQPGLLAIAEALTTTGCTPSIAKAAPTLAATFYGRRHDARSVVVRLEALAGELTGLVVDLRRGPHLVARSHARRVTARGTLVVLRPRTAQLPDGRYTLVVRHGAATLVRRTVRLGRRPM